MLPKVPAAYLLYLALVGGTPAEEPCEFLVQDTVFLAHCVAVALEQAVATGRNVQAGARQPEPLAEM